MDDGETFDWSDVIAWEPPRRFAMHWYPGRTADTASAEDGYDALKKYARDLTKDAREGKLGSFSRRLVDGFPFGTFDHVVLCAVCVPRLRPGHGELPPSRSGCSR